MSDYESEYDVLADRLDRLEEMADSESYSQPENAWDEYVPEQIAMETLQDGQSAREYLEGLVQETREAVYAEARLHPDLEAATAPDPLDEAMRIVRDALPDFDESAPQLTRYLEESGTDLSPVIATGDSAKIAKAVFIAKATMDIAEHNRQLKQSAQTMSGTNSPRDPGPTEWDRIKSANPNIARVHLG